MKAGMQTENRISVFMHHHKVQSKSAHKCEGLKGDEGTFEAVVARKREELADVRYQAVQNNLEAFRNEALQLHEDVFKMYQTSLGQCRGLQERLAAVQGALATEKSNVKRLNVLIRESELSNSKLRIEITQLNEQRITRDSDISRLRLLAEEAQNKVYQIERENVELKRRLDAVSQGCRDAKQASLQLQSNLDAVAKEKERLQRAAAASESTRGGQSAEYQSLIAHLREEVQMMHSALKEAKIAAEVIQEELEATKSQNAILNAKLKRQTAQPNMVQSEDVSSLEKEISRLNAKLKERQSEKSALESEKNSLLQQLEKQSKEITGKLQQVEIDKAKAVQKLQQENEDLNRKLASVTTQARSILQSKSEDGAAATTTAGFQSPSYPSLTLNQTPSPGASFSSKGSGGEGGEKNDDEEDETPRGFFSVFGIGE